MVKQGDIVWINVNPQIGNEQKGKRPCVCVSNDKLKRYENMVTFAPITNKDKDYPFHVRLPKNAKTTGVIMTDQLKAMDISIRKYEYIETLPKDFMSELLQIIRAVFELNE